MPLLDTLNLDDINEIISKKGPNDFFELLSKLPNYKREYIADENRLNFWFLDESNNGCQITISNVLDSSSITINPFCLAGKCTYTKYTSFDSFNFSKAMDTHLLTPEELRSKQQLVSEKKKEQARKDALKNAHYSFPYTCDLNTCEYCINEQIWNYEKKKLAHEAKMRLTFGPNFLEIMGGGRGYT